jgi:aminopeptidase-like protein
MSEIGQAMYDLAVELFPINRSLTGEGVRQTFAILRDHLPKLSLHEVPSGTPAFDWNVPPEWVIRQANLVDPDGNKTLDFKDNNLHVVGYSTPVDKKLTLDELQEHLYSLPDQPDAIPYITSYYKERWGFCLSHDQRQALKPGEYHAVIDSELKNGSLTYGEWILPGESEQEIFISTYICHPSMANNELSGPVVATHLAKWIRSEPRRYTYRVIFVPETIGSIVYLSRNLEEMQRKIVAGFNLTCIGDDRVYSYLESRGENTLADRAAQHVLGHMHPDYIHYSYLERGSDERQYCSPGVDLPVASVMRSKYGEYPEYHTSLDNLDLISPQGLAGGYEVMRTILECLEANRLLRVTVSCEPQLGKRGLYPTVSTKQSGAMVRDMMNLIAYSDGKRDLLEVAEKIKVPMWELIPIAERLEAEGLLEEVSFP